MDDTALAAEVRSQLGLDILLAARTFFVLEGDRAPRSSAPR
jgi:hypothetical protein